MSIVIWSNNMHIAYEHTKFQRMDDIRAVGMRGRRIATYDNENNRTAQPTKDQKTKVQHLFYRFNVFASSVFIGYFLFCGRNFSRSRMKKSKRRPNSIKYQLHVIKRIICVWERKKEREKGRKLLIFRFQDEGPRAPVHHHCSPAIHWFPSLFLFSTLRLQCVRL